MVIFHSYVKLPEGTTFTAELRIQKRAMHAYLYWMAAPSRSGPRDHRRHRTCSLLLVKDKRMLAFRGTSRSLYKKSNGLQILHLMILMCSFC
jgi:hypothetical protein